jgi:YD repeat-containing protein
MSRSTLACIRTLVGVLLSAGFVSAIAQVGIEADQPHRNNKQGQATSEHNDQVDTYRGSMRIVNRDIVLPGNGGLTISVNRVYDTAALGFREADRDGGLVAQGDPGKSFYLHGTGSIRATSQWVGLGLGWRMFIGPKVIVLPQGVTGTRANSNIDWVCSKLSGQETNLNKPLYTLQHEDGREESFYWEGAGSWKVRTPSQWRLECDGPGGSHRLRSPDGTMYVLGQIDPLDRSNLLLQTTQVIDKNGNSFSIAYQILGSDPIYDKFTYDASATNVGEFPKTSTRQPRRLGMPVSVTSSDGRSLTFTYDSGVPATAAYDEGRQVQLTSISTGDGRTWRYEFTPSYVYSLLSGVVRPDGTRWSYSYYDYSATGPSFSSSAVGAPYHLKTATQPMGGVATYSYGRAPRYMGTWMKSECDYQTSTNSNGPGMGLIYANTGPHDSFRVSRKQTSDGGVWDYAYTPGTANGQYDVTTITNSFFTRTVKHFGYGYFRPVGAPALDKMAKRCHTDAQALVDAWKLGLMAEEAIPGQTTRYVWTPMKMSDRLYRVRGDEYLHLDSVSNAPLLVSKEVVLDGATYGEYRSNFDAYGNPTLVSERGSNGGNRDTTISYVNDVATWIIGLTKDETFSGGSTLRSFDTKGNLLSESRDGVTTTYTYDSFGNEASVTRPRNLTYYYSNYKLGTPQTENQPGGVNLSRVVDAAGRITSETNGNSKTTTWTYDGLDRVTSVTYPAGNPKSISYGANTKTATRGSLVEATVFDGFGRATSVTLGGVAKTFTFDFLGRKTFESDPGVSTGTSFQYDAVGRVVRTTNADSSYRVTAYGPATKQVTDEQGKTTVYSYRSYKEPSESILMGVAAHNPAASISIARNARDLVTSITQGGLTRSYGYNANYFVTSVVDPETGTTTFGRDAAGNMTSKSIGSSGTTTYTYDARNRLTGVAYPGGRTVSTSYSGTDKILSTSAPAGSRSYVYDANDNVTQESVAVDGYTLAAGYSYNGNDQLQSIVYPRSGRMVILLPDVLGRPTRVGPYVTAASYWPSGQLRQLTYGNGTITDYGQNNRLWPSSFATRRADGSVIHSTSYAYDGIGNLLTINDPYVSGWYRNMGYDDLHRLSSVTGPWGAGSISYSGVGNITSQNFGGFAISYNYDGSNKLASVGGTYSTPYTYDAYGSVLSAWGNSYSYDGVPNLTCVNCALASKIEYAYDGSNQRISVLKGGVKTYEFYDGHGNLLVEFAPGINKLTEYFYMGSKRIAQEVTQ